MVLWAYISNCWLAMGYSNNRSIRHSLTVSLNIFLTLFSSAFEKGKKVFFGGGGR